MFTIQQVQVLSSPTSFAKGQVYFLEGAVGGVWREGTRFEGRVKGQEWYEQTLDFAQAKAVCTCPMGNKSRWCKHLVAMGIQLTTGSFSPEPISTGTWRKGETFAEIKGRLAPLSEAEQASLLSPFSGSPVGLEAMRYVLAAYEAVGERIIRASGKLPLSWPPPLINVRDQFLAGFRSGLPEVQQLKFCLDLWFHRWGYWEQRYAPDRPQASLRYRADFHQTLLAGFKADPISAHYLLMKLEGYGLNDYI